MKVKIVKSDENSLVPATIFEAKSVGLDLPSLADGWRFNFKKHSRVTGYVTYVVVTEETPTVIEGCLIFEMKNKVEPYMAFVELAPHNKGLHKK
ncbi:hypothetical protein [Flavobacterium sp. SM2513]|uniref:hypothetical protein n=1 Tax=Flavobacterium sp. SM2513 TaxID=3424766 RepID=UPI003D7F8A65